MIIGVLQGVKRERADRLGPFSAAALEASACTDLDRWACLGVGQRGYPPQDPRMDRIVGGLRIAQNRYASDSAV